MKRIGLISCAAEKRNIACAAQDLYISDLFAKSKAYAVQNCDRWYTLSAKHGLLDPLQIVEPYDQTLNTIPLADRREWANRILAQLRPNLESGDTITMLAGQKYREFLVPPLKADGFTVFLPLEGLMIGQQLQWLKEHLRPATDHKCDLDRFYRLLDTLRAGLGGMRSLGECSGKQIWPRRGVYFFFEKGEERRDHPDQMRVVRVGTHAVSAGSKSTLWGRLRAHRGSQDSGGNHRGSVFRLHVGNALMDRSRSNLQFPTWAAGKSAAREIRDSEKLLEEQVSGHLTQMKILWLAVDDEPAAHSQRGYLERNAIGLLSSPVPSKDPPSSSWLGSHSVEATIRQSGLWNLNHVGEPYDPAFLDVLSATVDSMVARPVGAAS